MTLAARIVQTVAVLAAVSGCRSVVERDPFAVGRVFVLESIAGQALPAPEAQNSACGSVVITDTLALYDDGTGLRRSARLRQGHPHLYVILPLGATGEEADALADLLSRQSGGQNSYPILRDR